MLNSAHAAQYSNFFNRLNFNNLQFVSIGKEKKYWQLWRTSVNKGERDKAVCLLFYDKKITE